MCCYCTRACYERVKFVDPVLASFVLSAWWHGFYPGYYVFFVTLALYIMAGRKVAKLICYLWNGSLPFTTWCALDEAVVTSSLSIPPGSQMVL